MTDADKLRALLGPVATSGAFVKRLNAAKIELARAAASGRVARNLNSQNRALKPPAKLRSIK